MEYRLKGQLNVSDAPEVAAYLQTDKAARRFSTRKGTSKIRIAHGVNPDIFNIDAAYDSEQDCTKAFSRVAGLMEFDQVPGWVGWHLCHNDGNQPRAHTEVFRWPADGGDQRGNK